MRKRNLEFMNNIGKLTEEINNQDLEMVNGGKDDEKITVSNWVCTLNSTISKVTTVHYCDRTISEACILETFTIKCVCKKNG